VVAGELVVERRELLRAELLHLDLELGRLSGEPRARVVGRIRHAERQPGATVLPDELLLERERERPAPRLEQDALAAHGLAAVQPAREVDDEDVARLDDRAIFDRPELCDRLAQCLERAIHVRIGDRGRRARRRDVVYVAELDRGSDLDRRRVAERFAGREIVRVDLRGAHDREPVALDGAMERVLDEAPQHLAPHLGTEHALEDGARCLSRAEPAKPRLLADELVCAIELRLHRGGRDLDSQPFANRCQILERDLRVHHRTSTGIRACERGDSNPHGCPRDPKSRASASSATLASVSYP
jgi:hypothetical protein